MSKAITIGKATDGHAVKLDIARLIVSRALVTAASGGGKSWLLRVILEAVSATTQTIVIDPEGEFASLREIRDMVLVGPDGDLPADPRSAGLLCRRLMERNVSAVIDIFELTPSKRREFVAAFCTEMINLPKDLWRPCFVAIDEAHEFAPKVADKHDIALEPVTMLFSKGRKRGYAPIIATQRLAKLHNDVAAEAKNRFIGQTVLDVDQKRAADFLGWGKERWPDLRDLSPPGREGEWFGVGPALTDRGVVKFRAGAVKSHHPKAGETGQTEPPQPSKKIAAVLGELKDLPRQVEEEARTVAQLKAENAELKRQIKSPAVVKDAKAIESAVAAAERRERAELSGNVSRAGVATAALKRQLEQVMKTVDAVRERGFPQTGVSIEDLESIIRAAVDQAVKLFNGRHAANAKVIDRATKDLAGVSEQLAKLIDSRAIEPVSLKENSVPRERPTASDALPSLPRNVTNPAAVDAGLNAPEQKVLNSIAFWESIDIPDPLDTAVAFAAGYSVTSSAYEKPRGSLRKKGLIAFPTPERRSLTDDGRQLAAAPTVKPTIESLHATILGVLDGPQNKLMTALIKAYPKALSNEQLAEAAGYSLTSSAYEKPRGSLRKFGLIEFADGGIVATKVLFPDKLL